MLGVGNPESLLCIVFYAVGLNFSLRGGQEHRDLKLSQFTRVPADGYDSNTYYQYIENGSKNYQGRFSETGRPIRLFERMFSQLRIVALFAYCILTWTSCHLIPLLYICSLNRESPRLTNLGTEIRSLESIL